MKVEDSALSSYLVQNLQPLTKADPNLLSKYIAALLKNTKPKKELETLCVDKLFDFLGDESEPFVRNLFCALENGTILTYNEECETTVAEVATASPARGGAKLVGEAMYKGHHIDLRNSCHPSYTNTGMFSDSEGEEVSNDESDDRNPKHKRWPSRPRFIDRYVKDHFFNKVNTVAINGNPKYDTNHFVAENLKCLNNDHMSRDNQPKRFIGHDHAHESPSNARKWGSLKGSSFFRSDGRFKHLNNLSPEVQGQGSSGALAGPSAGVHEQRTALDGLDCTLPLGPPFVPYSGRPGVSRENLSHSPRAQVSGFSNGYSDQALLCSDVMQGTKGFSTTGVLALTGGLPKCIDFEERGYCLRGDLCPMDHGANRIVVEDVQSLSQFNLSLTLPSERGMTSSSISVLTPPLSPYSSNLSIAARDSTCSVLNEPNVLKAVSTNNACPEPDVYDPDQPFLNREQPAALVTGLKRHSSYLKYWEDSEEEAVVLKRCRGTNSNKRKFERSSVYVTPQTSGQLVFDHISHIHQGERNGDNSSGPRSIFSNEVKSQKREFVENYEPQMLAGTQKNHFTEKQERLVKSSGMMFGVSSVFQTEDRLHSQENSNYVSGSKRSMGPGSERAQRTLYVSCIPSINNRRELLRAHFKKFGEVVDIRAPSQGDRAFIQFSQQEDAEAALKSPEAVLGNRFIRLSWARRDSLPITSIDDDVVTPLAIGGNMNIGLTDLGLLNESSSVKTKQQGAVVSAASGPVLKTAGKASTLSVLSVSLTALPKKQEELELMKEELRRKQDELAQKRDDFRRKLDRLSKQGGGATTRLLGDQGCNVITCSSNKQATLETLEAGLDNSQREISDLTASFAKALPSIDQPRSCLSSEPVKVSLDLTRASTGSSTPLSQRGSRGHSPGAGSPPQCGPMPGNLDNLTTAFCVVPPFPGGLADVTSLNDHFSMFEDLASVQVEDVDKKVQYFKVTFHTRSAAEQAFLQGRSYQGSTLHFSWAPSSGISPGLPSTGNAQVDSVNDNSSQTLCEAPVELGSREANLSKK